MSFLETKENKKEIKPSKSTFQRKAKDFFFFLENNMAILLWKNSFLLMSTAHTNKQKGVYIHASYCYIYETMIQNSMIIIDI